MIRLSCSPQGCGYVVHYGRTSCTPIFDIKAGEIQLVDVDFCSGCGADAALSITGSPVVSVETDVMGAGPVTASVQSVDGCMAVIIVDATAATPASRYAIRVTADISDGRRLSDCFKIRVAGSCSSQACGASCGCQSGGASAADACNTFLGQETVSLVGVAALSPPPGTVTAEVFVTTKLHYMLNAMPPAGGPAIFADVGTTIPLNSLTEITGFRAESFCPLDENGDPVPVSFVATYRGC